MNAFTDNFTKMTNFDADALAPVRQVASVAINGFEKLARANYAFAGDVIEFAVAQAKLPLNVSDPKELMERQVETGKAFAGMVSQRMNDYVALGKDLQESMASVVDTEVVEPVQEATTKKTRARKAA